METPLPSDARISPRATRAPSSHPARDFRAFAASAKALLLALSAMLLFEWAKLAWFPGLTTPHADTVTMSVLCGLAAGAAYLVSRNSHGHEHEEGPRR
jgi:hypothetical protein